jgi:hypothetical protein
MNRLTVPADSLSSGHKKRANSLNNASHARECPAGPEASAFLKQKEYAHQSEGQDLQPSLVENKASHGSSLLTGPQAAAYLNVPLKTLERWRYERTGPDFVKLGNGKRSAVRYRKNALEEYIRRNTQSTSVRAAKEVTV